MDIEEYRKSSETNSMTILPPKCIMPSQVIHDRRISEARCIMSSTIHNSTLNERVDLTATIPTTAPKYGDSLKLRRPKKEQPASHSNETSMLELMLGLASGSST